LIVKQAILFTMLIILEIYFWNQPVLRNKGSVYCSRKQRMPVIRIRLMIDQLQDKNLTAYIKRLIL